MADLRVPSILPVSGASTPPRKTEAVLAAQRAFFDAALNTAASPAPTRAPAAVSVAATMPSAPTRVAAPASPGVLTPPTRALRPGSLVDIRV